MKDHQGTPEKNQDRLIPFSAGLAMLGIGRTTAYRLLAEGQLPQPIKIGSRNFFSSEEIQQWIAGKLAARDGFDAGSK